MLISEILDDFENKRYKEALRGALISAQGMDTIAADLEEALGKLPDIVDKALGKLPDEALASCRTRPSRVPAGGLLIDAVTICPPSPNPLVSRCPPSSCWRTRAFPRRTPNSHGCFPEPRASRMPCGPPAPGPLACLQKLFRAPRGGKQHEPVLHLRLQGLRIYVFRKSDTLLERVVGTSNILHDGARFALS